MLLSNTKEKSKISRASIYPLFLAMEYPYKLLGFVGIQREALKIFSRNGNLMATVILLNLFLGSSLYLSNILSIKPLITDWVMEQTLLPTTIPSSPEYANLVVGMKRDIKIFAGVELIFLLAIYMASLLFQTATIILASAIAYGWKDISIKELLLQNVRSWKRPFVTLLYTYLLSFGYWLVIVGILLFPLWRIVDSPVVSRALTLAIWISAMIFYTYLDIVWKLALVVSVLEERCGIEALGKAAELVKGMRLNWFLINLAFTISSTFAVWGMRSMFTVMQSAAISIINQSIIENSITLMGEFWFMALAYIAFYYQCKKNHGEEPEFEFQWSVEYAKIPTTSLINENIP